jgi:Fe-S cluster assembly ATP-binding protein
MESKIGMEKFLFLLYNGQKDEMIILGGSLMLELKNLSFQVPDANSSKKEIIKNINLKLKDHTFTVITGPNGGGKSTLAKLIMGMEMPTDGQILWNGQDITAMNVTERAKLGISFAFQQPVRFKGIKVKDLITLAAGEKLSTSSACEYLSKVGLCARDYINRDVDGSLSGGELKRIEIATIIARDTPLSVFDEPEAGIDLWSFNNLIKVFEEMHEKRENSLIIISHQERILNIADEVVVIADGSVKAQGAREDILPELLNGTSSCKFYQ